MCSAGPALNRFSCACVQVVGVAALYCQVIVPRNGREPQRCWEKKPEERRRLRLCVRDAAAEHNSDPLPRLSPNPERAVPGQLSLRKRVLSRVRRGNAGRKQALSSVQQARLNFLATPRLGKISQSSGSLVFAKKERL